MSKQKVLQDELKDEAGKVQDAVKHQPGSY